MMFVTNRYCWYLPVQKEESGFLPLSGIWMRLDVGWFRIDWIDDQGKPMLVKRHGGQRTCKEYPEMMFPVMRDETSNGSV